MTDRKWKVGDRVKYGPGIATITSAPGVLSNCWTIRYDNGVVGLAYSHEMQRAESELDAIERDFKDLFDRMRAEIERLK